MKKLFIARLSCLLAITLSLTVSCSDVSDGLGSSSLTLTAERLYFPANGKASPEFIVLNQKQEDVTEFATIFYNGEELTDRFTTTEIGSYNFVATYEGMESDTLTIESELHRTNKKVLLEDFTAEWCGWCPQASYNIGLLLEEDDNVLAVEIHHNSDPVGFADVELIRTQLDVKAWPGSRVGRVRPDVGFNTSKLSSAVTWEITKQMDHQELLAGIAINTALSGSNVTVDVDLEFYNDINKDVGLTIYLIENNVVGVLQQNYFSGDEVYSEAYFYSQPKEIPDYIHHRVLRKVATDIYGDDLPLSETVRGNEYSHEQKTIDISDYDADNCYVIAFLHYSLDGEIKTILNAQQVKVGGSIGFEE